VGRRRNHPRRIRDLGHDRDLGAPDQFVVLRRSEPGDHLLVCLHGPATPCCAHRGRGNHRWIRGRRSGRRPRLHDLGQQQLLPAVHRLLRSGRRIPDRTFLPPRLRTRAPSGNGTGSGPGRQPGSREQSPGAHRRTRGHPSAADRAGGAASSDRTTGGPGPTGRRYRPRLQQPPRGGLRCRRGPRGPVCIVRREGQRRTENHRRGRRQGSGPDPSALGRGPPSDRQRPAGGSGRFHRGGGGSDCPRSARDHRPSGVGELRQLDQRRPRPTRPGTAQPVHQLAGRHAGWWLSDHRQPAGRLRRAGGDPGQGRRRRHDAGGGRSSLRAPSSPPRNWAAGPVSAWPRYTVR
jgi:hypothetical protein